MTTEGKARAFTQREMQIIILITYFVFTWLYLIARAAGVTWAGQW